LKRHITRPFLFKNFVAVKTLCDSAGKFLSTTTESGSKRTTVVVMKRVLPGTVAGRPTNVNGTGACAKSLSKATKGRLKTIYKEEHHSIVTIQKQRKRIETDRNGITVCQILGICGSIGRNATHIERRRLRRSSAKFTISRFQNELRTTNNKNYYSC
jgi:hypothetical protein